MIWRLTGAFFIVLSLAAGVARADVDGGPDDVASAQAGIASAHPLATEAGLAIMAAGGNAFDAAVAVGAALAVVEPYSSGIGGGGFWLIHRASDGYQTMLDGRERAPLAAHRDMYLDKNGEVDRALAMNGPMSAGIPGLPAALVHLAGGYGRLPLARSLEPAIRLAKDGFEVDEIYRRMAGFRLDALNASPDAAAIFLNEDGKVPAIGTLVRQPALSRTLERLARAGRAGFYEGETARLLVKGVRDVGGIWTMRDLSDYEVVEREPVYGRFGDVRVVSASPPSSGGIVLVEMLNILSGLPVGDNGEATRVHLIAEAMRRAYRDRAQYLGDPDFVEMPLKRLTSTDYAAGLRAGIRADRATPSEALPGVVDTPMGGRDTTHFSVIDRDGNRVAATLSINYPFGSGFVPPGTGVLLNDEMDDFAAKPGVPNAYGLVGADANAIEPGKRMLSSMTPTFLETGERVAVIGTPGGSRIITMVLLATLDFADGGTAESMVALPRFHHQYLPDAIEFEPDAFDGETVLRLEAMGHEPRGQDHPWGNLNAVVLDRRTGRVSAASDPRGIGSASVR
jgi:gamma-glutamyltranspeptidase/glutathione hydrolase